MKDKQPSRSAVIDIGTNSVKLLIAEESGEGLRVLESLKNIVPLGRDTFFRERISQETMNRTVTLLEKYAQKLEEYSIPNAKVIATTAVREARNKELFIDTVLRKTGFSVEVLTVGDVIYYIDAYLYHKLKDKYPLHAKNLLIAELGSGSLDISLLGEGLTLMNVGLPLGTLRLKQLMSKLDGSLAENYEAVGENIKCEFAFLLRNLPHVKIDDIILIDETFSGYVPAVLKKKLEPGFFQLTSLDTQALLKQLLDRNADEIAREYNISPEAADSFPGFAMILDTLAGLNEGKNAYILEASLGEAVLANDLLDYEISQKYNKTNQLVSIANSICRKYNVDIKHAQHVADLSDILFDAFKELLGLKKTDSLYLLLAATLHDIGMFISNRSHHKHTEFIVNNLNLFRLTKEEIKTIACIARYHRKGAPVESHYLFQLLPEGRQMLVQKLSSILRVANALDRSHGQKVKKLEVKFARSQDITLVVEVQGNFLLEKLDFLDKKDMFEDISGNKLNLKIQYV